MHIRMCLAMLLASNKELPSNFIFYKLGRPSTSLVAFKVLILQLLYFLFLTTLLEPQYKQIKTNGPKGKMRTGR